MKNENRNCGMNYPMYPNMGYMPYMYNPMMNNPIPFTSGGVTSNTIENQLNSLENQINMLDKRVTALENNKLNTNNYSSSNFQIM